MTWPAQKSRLLLPVLVVIGVLACACFEARSIATEQPANESDGGSDGGTDPVVDEELKHELCDLPLRAEHLQTAFSAQASLVELTEPNTFKVDDCGTVPPLSRCTLDQVCPPAQGFCMAAVPGEPGYCVRAHSSLESPLLAYRDGACHLIVLPLEKAALCCAKVPGVDCREFPFAERAGPGQFCADTDDCDAGLVCRGVVLETSGYPTDGNVALGVCQCPEASAERQKEPDLCGHELEFVWGKPAQPGTPGSCHPALLDGFVEEVLDSQWPKPTPGSSPEPTPLRAPAGAPAFTHQAPLDTGSPGGIGQTDHSLLVVQVTDMPESSPATKIADLAFGYSRYDLGILAYEFEAAFDLAGNLHLAGADVVNGVGVWSSSGTKAWTFERFSEKCQELRAFAIDPGGSMHLVCIDDLTVSYFQQTADGWVEKTYPRGNSLGDELTFAADGRAILVGLAALGVVLDLSTGETLWEVEPNIGAVGDAAYGGGTIAFTMDEYGAMSFDVVTSLDGQAFVREDVSSISQASGAKLSVSATGEVAVAHRTPEGIGLTQKRDGAWVTQLLTSDRGRPSIIHGADDDIQIYYTVDTNWDGREDELRRLREGTCASATGQPAARR